MDGSVERVRAVINGQQPDRPPLFDLLRNDAVLQHFAGEPPLPGRTDNVFRAYAPAVDATRPLIRAPQKVGEVVLPDGRRQQNFRWTSWTENHGYPSPEAYCFHKERELEMVSEHLPKTVAGHVHVALQTTRENRAHLGEVFYFTPLPGPNLMGLYGEVGLEEFSYYLNDCPLVIYRWLEYYTVLAEEWARQLPEDHGLEAGFMGDDIAWKGGTLFAPHWLREHYFPRLARCLHAFHDRGIKLLFHSDGNLMSVLDDLVDAGIDGLNPLEVIAGVEPVEVHRRHPQLFLAGGIDVSQLLPFGSPEEIRKTVRHTLQHTGGRLMVGSSTELNDQVPLENYLALRDEVLNYSY